MAFTAHVFGQKLQALRQDRDDTVEAMSKATGIGAQALEALEAGQAIPSGDEVLMVAEYFSCDFAWLIDDERQDPDANARAAARSVGGDLTSADRHAIADFMHLCRSQALLEEMLEQKNTVPQFKWAPVGRGFMTPPTHKEQGIRCAKAFRQWRELPPNAYIPNIFDWLRESGIRVFRRALQANSPISGLFVRHPDAGRCILINYSEDIYRQRFSAAHEAGHALMDDGKPYNVSRQSDRTNEWEELRADTFASAFLMPPELLRAMATPDQWQRPEKVLEVADKLFVSIPALLSALKRDGIIDEQKRDELKRVHYRRAKIEPELSGDLSLRERERKEAVLAAGLHAGFVSQGLEAHRRGLISLGKLAEMFLVEPGEIGELAGLFGMTLNHG